MNLESLLPVFILLGIFLLAFALEAGIMAYFKLKPFLPSLGYSVVFNVVSLSLLYFFARPFLSLLGYDIGKFNGLNTQPQVIAFLWWFCTVAEGALLLFFLRRTAKPSVFFVSLLMNLASFAFFYLFDFVSH